MFFHETNPLRREGNRLCSKEDTKKEKASVSIQKYCMKFIIHVSIASKQTRLDEQVSTLSSK